MAASDFPSDLNFVLQWEGGLSDDPHDPGGRTNRGITQATYDSFRNLLALSLRDVADITNDEVQSIYQEDYWAPAECDALVAELDLLQFDTSVNMGVRRALRFLQGAAGVTVDGYWGTQTQNAVEASDYTSLVTAYADARERYYRKLVQLRPDLSRYLTGWLNRLNAVRARLGLPQTIVPQGAPLNVLGHIAKIPDYGIDPQFDF
jgi:lysozyme family protein